jgi:hypothetical protein
MSFPITAGRRARVRGRQLAHSRTQNSFRPVVELLEERNLLSFLPPVNYPAGPGPATVAVGDFNNDGSVDLATANFGDTSVSVLLNNGDGTFRPGSTLTVGPSPAMVLAADLAGDANTDLVTANWTGGTVSVLLGNGDGTFKPAVNYAAGAASPWSLAVGDFTNHGILDLAVANDRAGSVSILPGHGDGTFGAPIVTSVGGRLLSPIAYDFNGDGNLDLAVTDYENGQLDILLGNGDGTFRLGASYAAGYEPISATLGDFNGDGFPDLAVADFNNGSASSVFVFLGNGDGTFQSAGTYYAGVGAEGLETADFNGDGNLDLAVSVIGNNSVSILLGNGDGSFGSPLFYPADNSPYGARLGVADFNGDGALDIAVANSNSNDVSVLLNANDWTGPSVGNRIGSREVARALPSATSLVGQNSTDGLPGAAGVGSESRPATDQTSLAAASGRDAVPRATSSETSIQDLVSALPDLEGTDGLTLPGLDAPPCHSSRA